MGWYATAQALKRGIGPYGSVKESLKGESDPPTTLSNALDQVMNQIKDNIFIPDKAAKLRIIYWSKRNGRLNPFKVYDPTDQIPSGDYFMSDGNVIGI